jgi:hypothetical protein
LHGEPEVGALYRRFKLNGQRLRGSPDKEHELWGWRARAQDDGASLCPFIISLQLAGIKGPDVLMRYQDGLVHRVTRAYFKSLVVMVLGESLEPVRSFMAAMSSDF